MTSHEFFPVLLALLWNVNVIYTLFCSVKPIYHMLFTHFSLQHIRKYGSAFLNSDGGVLLAGILDDGEYEVGNTSKVFCMCQ